MMKRLPVSASHAPYASISAQWPVLVCLLGTFQVLTGGHPLPIRSGGKTEAVLCALALRHPNPVARTTLLSTVWPDSDPALAGQALNSLVYSLHRLLEGFQTGQTTVLHADGAYRLNTEAGVEVDAAVFDCLVAHGEQEWRDGRHDASIATYIGAIELYRGDLVPAPDMYAVMERERLRVTYLTLLGRVADRAYAMGDFDVCLGYLRRMLSCDACREDAHQLAMRCYVRMGQRSQAFRQFALCETMLRQEFDAAPEESTLALYRQVRLDPGSI